MKTLHERTIHQFLSLYRFLGFGIAVLLVQVVPLVTEEDPPLKTYTILGSLGVYSLVKVFYPLHWRQKDRLTYLVLGGDLVICIFLLLYTNGLDSGYLLYALTPVITAALLFEERFALAVAVLLTLSLVVAHVGLSQWNDDFGWIMRGNYLPLLLVFVGFSFLIATVAYQTNLNIRRSIEMDAILEERRRLRQEMHDGVAQSLSYLGLKTRRVADSVSSQNTDKALAELEEIRKIVKGTYEGIRQSIDQLSADVKSFPLIPALADFVQEFSKNSGIQVRFDAPKYLIPISPVVELQLLRIVQEALTNIRKHAEATKVSVKLLNASQRVEIVVKDNGCGFFLADLGDSSTGYHGLNIMKERAESRGGTFEIVTAPGDGTEVKVSFPSEKVRL